jgi:hypothetical protein
VSIRGSSLFFFLVLHQLQSMSHEGTQFKKPGSVFISVYPRALRFSKKPGTAIDANRATAIQQLFKVFANPLQKKGTTEHTKHTDKRWIMAEFGPGLALGRIPGGPLEAIRMASVAVSVCSVWSVVEKH